MAGSEKRKEIIDAYVAGGSIPQVASKLGMSMSTIRRIVKNAGVIRTRADALQLAAKQGRIGGGLRGKKRVFSQEWKDAISRGMLKRKSTAVGVSKKANGYLQLTQGPNKHRSVHVVVMEKRLGRRLLDDECVHHIDGNRSNNDPSNLALVTRSGHSRLHRREDELAGKIKERKSNGRFR